MSRRFNHQLTAENFAEIIHRNFGFVTTEKDSFLGKMVQLDPHEAFTLSLVHGAPYLVNSTGFSLKGRMEVLIHRGVFQNNKYIYSPGLFGRKIDLTLCEGESPYYIWKRYPNIFKGDKYLIFREIGRGESSNIEKDVYEVLVARGYNPCDFMLFKISERGSNLEAFFEYLCCKLFGKMGYLTENQVPWFQQSFQGLTGGIPDFSAFKIPLLNELSKKNLLAKGRVVQELSTIFLWGQQGESSLGKCNYELILGEVKVSKSQKNQLLQQLERYAAVQLCSKEYAILHDEASPLSDYFGLIHIDDEYLLRMQEASKPLQVNLKMQQDDEIWLTNYSKFYLLANLPFDQVTQFINIRRKAAGKGLKRSYRSYDLIESVVMCPINDLLDFVKNQLRRASEAN